MKEHWRVVEDKSLPLIDASLVRVLVRIRNNETGEVREYNSEEILEHGEDAPSDFLWAEGNNACDCNRALLFARAKDADAEDPDRECSEERFAVQLVNPISGRVYYNEFDDELDAEFVG